MTKYNVSKNESNCGGKKYNKNIDLTEKAADICEKEICIYEEPICVVDCGITEDNSAEEDIMREEANDFGKGFSAKRLKIGAKISLKELINAQVDVDFAKANGEGISGYAKGAFGRAMANGYRGNAIAQGYHGRAAVSGEDSIAASLGVKGKARAGIGSWITLVEWKLVRGKWHIAAVRTERIDGEKLKADTWYILKNGEFTEAG